MEGRMKPQHDYPIQEVAGIQFNQQEHLMEIDTWLDVLFVQMDQEYKEMHRLPKKLSIR